MGGGIGLITAVDRLFSAGFVDRPVGQLGGRTLGRLDHRADVFAGIIAIVRIVDISRLSIRCHRLATRCFVHRIGAYGYMALGGDVISRAWSLCRAEWDFWRLFDAGAAGIDR